MSDLEKAKWHELKAHEKKERRGPAPSRGFSIKINDITTYEELNNIIKLIQENVPPTKKGSCGEWIGSDHWTKVVSGKRYLCYCHFYENDKCDDCACREIPY